MGELPQFFVYEEIIHKVCTDDASYECLLGCLLRKHREQPCTDLFAFYSEVAGHCLLACTSPLPQELRNAIEQWLWETLQLSPYALVRERMASVLAEFATQDETVRDRYLAFLYDQQQPKAQRKALILALGADGDVRLTSDILAMLLSLSERDGDLLLPLCDALIRLGPTFLMPTLLDLVKQKQFSPRHRGALIEVLVACGIQDGVVATLLSLLLDEEEHERVRILAALALRKLGDRSVLPSLFSLLNELLAPYDDDFESNEEEEPEQLELFADRERRDEREENEEAIPEKSVRKRCPDALAVPLICAMEPLLSPEQVPDLLPLLSTWRLNLSARECLASIFATRATPRFLLDQLSSLLRNQSISRTIRETFAIECSERQDVALLPVLQQREGGGKEDREVERAILVARFRLGDQTVAKQLKKVLGYKNFSTSGSNVQSALLRCVEISSVQSLLHDTTADPFLRHLAVVTLPERSEQEKQSMIPLLLSLLRSSSEPVELRREIMKILAEIGRNQAVIEGLLPFLHKSKLNLADDAHQALWAICARMGRVIVVDSERRYRLVQPEVVLKDVCGEEVIDGF